MAKRKNPNEDEPKDDKLNNDSDDSFGLPEIEYEPIKKKEEPPETPSEPEPEEVTYQAEPEREPEQEEVVNKEYVDQEVRPAEEEPYQYKPYEEEPSIWPKILGILLVIVIAAGVAWYFLYYQPNQEAKEKARIEAKQRADAKALEDKKNEELRVAREAAEKRRLDSLAAIKTPAVGEIETLTGRTGRYYVVIASALDKDLLMDYAKKLSAKGIGTKIIPPYGKFLVSRITIAEGDTFASAQAKADELKAEYGSTLWVLKY